MMKYIFLLSGDYPDLAKEEILSLLEISGYSCDCSLIDKLLIARLRNILTPFESPRRDDESDEKDENYEKPLNRMLRRAALTKSAYRLLFDCELGKLDEAMEKHDWNAVYGGSFCLRIYKQKICDMRVSEFANELTRSQVTDLARHIWNSVRHPKVSLEAPKTAIGIFIAADRAYCGLLIHKNAENFLLRSPHLRAFPHQGSLAPKVARALVNLTGIKENETLLDPFCGTGGFLIEAGLMGIKAVGYDINKIMADGCKENMKSLKIKNFKIFSANALRILHKFDYVVTDLPYGLNSNALLECKKLSWKRFRINKKIQKENFQSEIENFYSMFLKNLKNRLKKKAVIIFPSYVNYKSLLKAEGFKIEKEFSIYVHRSLTRRIVKIE